MEKDQVFIKRKGIYILGFCTFCMWMTLMAVYPVVPLIVRDLKTESSQIGGILGVASLIMLVINILAGLLSDRHGRKPYIVLGMLFSVLTSLWISTINSALIFYIAWLLGGVGRGVYLSPAFTVVADVYQPQERGKAMGILGSSIGLGSIAGYVLGGLIGDGFGWHFLFMVLAVINLLGLICSLYINETSKKTKELTVVQSLSNIVNLIKDASVSVLCVITIIGFSAGVAVIFIIPFAAGELDISLMLISLLFIPYEIIGVVGSIIIGNVSDKLGRKIPLICLMVISALAVLALALSGNSYMTILVPFAIVAFCEGPLIGVTTTMVLDIFMKKHPAGIGGVMGSYRTIYSLGAVLGPWLGGVLISNTSISVSFGIIAGILGFGLVLAFFTKETLEIPSCSADNK